MASYYNGTVEPPEVCDGNCPAACDDGSACTADSLVGADCGRQCSFTPITTCQDGDGCCPAGCSGADDDDCPIGCGDAVCSAAEICDSCPLDCGACGTCSDGVQNQAETGIDCGGPCIDCVEVADYYVAPTGDDAAAGTIDAPFATWQKLSSVMQPGDLAYLRGGTYRNTKALPTSAICRFSGARGPRARRKRAGQSPAASSSRPTARCAAR